MSSAASASKEGHGLSASALSSIVSTIDAISAGRQIPLNEEQIAFLTGMIEHDCSIPDALAHASLSKNRRPYLMRTLEKEIQALLQMRILAMSNDAINTMSDILTSTSRISNAQTKVLAAKEILDRAGLIKKEEITHHHNVSGGLFILPQKAPRTVFNEDGEEIYV